MTPEIYIRTPNLPNTNNLINHANTEPTAINEPISPRKFPRIKQNSPYLGYTNLGISDSMSCTDNPESH